MSDMARINALLALGEIERQVKAEARQQLRLGQIIEKLGEAGQDKTCLIEGSISGNPDRVSSYRGYYSDLAIEPDGDEDIAVDAVLTMLRGALWHEFEGWKGGHYFMREDTLVWVASRGETGSHGVVDVVEEKHAVVIVTAIVEDW